MAGFTVITTMKNEGAFLLEWVAHHKALGFDNLLICTNDCADPTDRIALRLQEMGLARHHATKVWAATSIQRSALKQARHYAEVQQADWLYVCDADEFLCVKTGDGSARALVAAAGPAAEVIAVPWRIFGANGQAGYHDLPVTQQFQRASPLTPPRRTRGIYAKSLFRSLEHLHRIGIHRPVARPDLGRPLRTEMPGGAPVPDNLNRMSALWQFGVAQVNHYALRSRDSFLVKRDRGRVNHANDVMEIDYWDRFDRSVTPCHAIRRYDAAVAGWRTSLLADAALEGLHHKAVAWHRNKIAELKARPDYAALVAATDERLTRCDFSAS
tara:strand:- start:5042 stop:6022 length:981 start_codon:yes stop_codon:yes gene_type:complete